MMQSRQEPAAEHKNRATGFSDADWGALEKRLSDTRDLLQDILLHLRRVLDNLKTVGNTYQSAGRTWRRAESATGGARRPYGPRAHGAAGDHGDARKASGAAKASAGSGAGSTAGTGGTGGARFQSASSKTSGTGAAGGKTFAGAAGRAGATGPAGATGATGARASQDRQAGNGFSWSTRTRAESASSSKFNGGAGQKSSSQDWRTQREARAESGPAGAAGRPGERTDNRAGNRDSFGSQSRQERAHDQSSQHQSQHQGRQQNRQQSHRATGTGGGSSYQEYRQRTHKSPLGSGRMTLTQACALLCITYPCTADDIKSAYRKQARRHHPDLGGNEEMMKSINQAYELALSWCSPLRGKAATWAA